MTTFSPVDGGLRHRFTESEWAAVVRADALAEHAPRLLPPWARPLDGLDGTQDHPDGSTSHGSGPDAPGPGDTPGEDLLEALMLGETAVVVVEVAAAARGRGVLGAFWSDGHVGSALVRGADTSDDGTVRLRPGVEVSVFEVGDLVDEVMRLVPAAPDVVDASPAVVPVELGVALATALRAGDRAVVDAVLAELGLGEVPPVIEAASSPDGSCVVTVRGAAGASAGSWLRTSLGWVGLSPAPEESLRHTPVTRAGLTAVVVEHVAARLGGSLEAWAGR